MSSMNESSYKPIIFTVAAIVLLAIVISTISAVSGTKKPSGTKQTSTPAATSPATIVEKEKPSRTFDAYIAGIDTSRNVITLCELGTTDFEEYTYTGATDIRTAFDKQVTASTLTAGEFFTAGCSDGGVLLSLIGMKNVDVYRNVRNLTIEPDLKRVRIGDAIYRYDDSLLLLNEGYFVNLSTLNEADVIDIYSIDNLIYLIKIVSGHGYLELLNCAEFVGGTITVDTSKSCQISAGMQLSVSEGHHTFTAVNGTLSGTSEIDIVRDSTSFWSLAQYLPEPPQNGIVSFTVSPYGAILYIDGIEHSYERPVTLVYGEHNIQVMLTGYTPYIGKITVSQISTAINIALSPVPDLDTEGGDTSENISDIPSEDSSDNAPADSVKSEDDYGELIIRCTEGAAVFLDDVYKGIIEDGSFRMTKPTGTHEIRLTCEGYETVRYQIALTDDNADAEITFPAMVLR